MAQNEWWARDVQVASGTTPQERKTDADTVQSEASAGQSRASTTRTLTLLPAEKREAEAKATKAEIEAREVGKPKAPSAEQTAFDTTTGNMKAAVDTINLLTRQFNQTLSGKGLIKSSLEYLPSQEKGAINTTGAGLADVGLSVFKVPGAGTQSDKDAERFVAANQPSTTDFDYTFLGKIYNLRRRLDAKAKSMGLGPIQWIEPNERSARDYLSLPEEDRLAIGLRSVGTFGDVPPELSPEGAAAGQATKAAPFNAPSGLSVMPEPGVDRSAPLPGRSNEPEYKTVPEETGLGVSDLDRKNAAILQQALDEGADEQKLQDLAKALNMGTLDSAKLRPVIEYRDNYLRQGGRGPSGALIVPAETPITPEKMAEVKALNSGTNAFLAKTGNALAGGQVANITSVFDPEGAERKRRSLDIYSEASPYPSLAGTVVGAIPSTATVAGGLMKAGLAPTRAAFLADLGYGTATGAGENPDNPLLGAIEGAGVSTLGSLAGRYAIAPALEAGGRGLSYLSSKYGPKFAPKPTYSDRTISGKLGAADEINQRLEDAARLELPMGLVDVSTPAQTLGRQVARRSQEVAGDAEAALGERAANRIDRLKESITKFVGQPYDDLRRAEDDIERAADDAAAPLYEKALSRPAPVDDKLDNLLNTTLGRKGLQQAYTYAESRGIDPKALGFDLDDQGLVKLVQKPSWETLHYIRKGLQREIDQYRDPVTRSLDTSNPNVDNAQNFLRRYDGRLDVLNPDYAAAKSAWSQYIAPRDYLELGIKALDPNTPPADVQRTLARISAMPDATPEQAALKEQAMDTYRRGFATAQRTAVDNAKSANTDPYGVILGTKRQQQKLNLIAQNAPDFAKSAELEGRMLATERVMKPSAPAAGRAEAEAGLTGTNLLGAIGDTLLTGSPVLSAANLVRNAAAQPGVRGWLADQFGLGAPFRAGARAKELAPMLMDLDPEGALSSVQKAQQRIGDYNQSVQAPRAAGTYVGGLGAVTGANEANRPEEYSVPQQPLSQGIVIDMIYGTGSKLNPDGSVTTRFGATVPPELVKQQVAEKAKSVTPYYGS